MDSPEDDRGAADECRRSRSALAGYDGSPSAANAIEAAAGLLPDFEARIVHVWSPPFADAALRDRLRRRAGSLDELVKLFEQEGEAEARRVAADGVAIAGAAGWRAEPLTRRAYGGEGLGLALVAEELGCAVVVVGSRGLSGVRAALGSVSDIVSHYSPVPALVVPHPPRRPSARPWRAARSWSPTTAPRGPGLRSSRRPRCSAAGS